MMTTVICDFMSDENLEAIAENLCRAHPEQFTHVFSHKKPQPGSCLAKLHFWDATLLYRHDLLSRAFPSLHKQPVSLQMSKDLLEAQSIFLSLMDRTQPDPGSTKERLTFFWDLVGYYLSFFNQNPDVSSVIFDNVPHLPWDLVFMLVARYRGKRTLMLRKTGVRGYIFVDEDFRPDEGKWKFQYSGLTNPLVALTKDGISQEALDDLSFSKGQVGGHWPDRKKPSLARRFLRKLRKWGFADLVVVTKAVLKGPANNTLGASLHTKQCTIYAGMKPVGRCEHLKLTIRCLKKNRETKQQLEKLIRHDLPLKKPFIYYAMHFQPERTTMPEGLSFDDQILAINILSKALPEGWALIIKEHPKQFVFDLRSLHARQALDYRRIDHVGNVYFAPLEFSQDRLVEQSQMTATISGSVSWEGLIKGKPSLVFSENWHAGCPSTKFIHSVDTAKQAIAALRTKNAANVLEDVRIFLREVAPSLIFGALNKNHLRMFFGEAESKTSLQNISSAIMQRLKSN